MKSRQFQSSWIIDNKTLMFFSLLYIDRYVIYLCIQDKERESVVYIRVVGSREPQMQIYQQFSRFLYIKTIHFGN